MAEPDGDAAMAGGDATVGGGVAVSPLGPRDLPPPFTEEILQEVGARRGPGLQRAAPSLCAPVLCRLRVFVLRTSSRARCPPRARGPHRHRAGAPNRPRRRARRSVRLSAGPLARARSVQMLQGLPTGARLATMTCYDCWKERKFPTGEFVSFLHSIAVHSPQLARLFADHAAGEGGGSRGPAGAGAGGADKTQEIPEEWQDGGASQSDGHTQGRAAPSDNVSAAGSRTTAQDAPPHHAQAQGEDSQRGGAALRGFIKTEGRAAAYGAGNGAGVACGDSEGVESVEGLGMDEGLMASPTDPDAATEESETDRVQHARRLQEVQRRRLEGVGGEEGEVKQEADVPHGQKVSRYLARTFKEMVQALPFEARGDLAVAVRQYVERDAPPDALAAEINALVDRHSIVVPLKYKPVRTHSGQQPSWVSLDRKRTLPGSGDPADRQKQLFFCHIFVLSSGVDKPFCFL